MPFVAIPDTLKCEVIWLFDNAKPVVNVLHLRPLVLASPYTQADVDQWATDVFNAITTGGTHWLGRVANSIQLTEVKVTDISTITGHQGVLAVSGHAGEIGDTSLPPSDAAVISLTTAVRSRRTRGRVYVCGIPAGHLATGGVLTAGAISGLQNMWDNFTTVLGAASNPVAPAVASRLNATSQAVTGRVVSPNVRSQRRRELDH